MVKSKQKKWSDHKTKPSTKASDYFYKLMKKKALGQRFTQKERVFLRLYFSDVVRCFEFSLQERPAIMSYSARIMELRNEGFAILDPVISYEGTQKFTEYTMLKDREFDFEEPKKESFSKRLFK